MEGFHRAVAAVVVSLALIVGGVPSASAKDHGDKPDNAKDQGKKHSEAVDAEGDGNHQSGSAVPEVEAASLGAATALLVGGLLILRDRHHR